MMLLVLSKDDIYSDTRVEPLYGMPIGNQVLVV
jgi:hypothetical protein